RRSNPRARRYPPGAGRAAPAPPRARTQVRARPILVFFSCVTSQESRSVGLSDCSSLFADDVQYVIQVGFQEEMSAVEEFDARIRCVPPERRGTGRTKVFIVLPPDGQHGDAGRSQPVMDPRVQLAITGVVGEQGKLCSIDAGPSHL